MEEEEAVEVILMEVLLVKKEGVVVVDLVDFQVEMTSYPVKVLTDLIKATAIKELKQTQTLVVFPIMIMIILKMNGKVNLEIKKLENEVNLHRKRRRQPKRMIRK